MAFDSQSCFGDLSPSEIGSLSKLCGDGTCDDIPAEHAARLIQLGFVELVGGALEPLGPSRILIRLHTT